ncbi:MAG: hypothetical protein JWP81_2816 [Ferruginibacter sp.]|nr:hypothetical protein [Ferruginibacter sp.]
MNIQELTNKCTELDKLINSTIISDIEDTFPILDGVFDPEKYLSAKYKILWILKEPYDEFDDDGVPFGGGWHLKDVILPKQKFQEFTGGRKTFEPMIYASWGILNNFCLWDDMNDVSKDPTMLEALKSIAYINVKKLPGYKASYYKTINDAYAKHKDILLKQIEYINPDIIIGGATLGLFINDLGLSKKDNIRHKGLNYFIKENKIFIEAYHPAQRTSSTGVTQQMYCNDIITAVQEWTKTNI